MCKLKEKYQTKKMKDILKQVLVNVSFVFLKKINVELNNVLLIGIFRVNNTPKVFS